MDENENVTKNQSSKPKPPEPKVVDQIYVEFSKVINLVESERKKPGIYTFDKVQNKFAASTLNDIGVMYAIEILAYLRRQALIRRNINYWKLYEKYNKQ